MALEDDILRTYLKVNHQATRRFRGHYGKVNLTFPQALVLSILDSEGKMPISSLADMTGSANSTISGVVDRLERMELVHRIRSDTDRRVIYVETTPKYQEIRKRMTTGVSDYFADLMANVSEEDRQTIYKGLTLLNSALQGEE